MGPIKGHDVHLYLHIHGLASNSQRGPAWLQACTSPPASASLSVGTADMSHATWLIFFLRSICLFTLHTCYKPTITKDPGALRTSRAFLYSFSVWTSTICLQSVFDLLFLQLVRRLSKAAMIHRHVVSREHLFMRQKTGPTSTVFHCILWPIHALEAYGR